VKDIEIPPFYPTDSVAKLIGNVSGNSSITAFNLGISGIVEVSPTIRPERERWNRQPGRGIMAVGKRHLKPWMSRRHESHATG
jgi:hypothetical protein